MISYQFDPASLRKLGEETHQIYAGNAPFPHIVIDDFFDPKILRPILAEVDSVDRSRRYAKFLDRKTDHNKFAFFPEAVGAETSRLFYFLNSGPFLGYMEKLTGIENLLADPSYFGGYVNENFIAVQEALALTEAEIATLARNSFIASFMTQPEKAAALAAFDGFHAKW